jgi:hypothetical protein
MVSFDSSEAPIALQASGQENAVFVLGSAVPHPHSLHLGYYSVHASVQALEAGERRIAELAVEGCRGASYSVRNDSGIPLTACNPSAVTGFMSFRFSVRFWPVLLKSRIFDSPDLRQADYRIAKLDGTEHLNEFYVREVLSNVPPNPMIALVSRYSSKP